MKMFYQLLVLLYAVYLASTNTESHECLVAFLQIDKDTKNSASSDNAVTPAYELNHTIVEAINKQIRIELAAHYVYLSLAYHFDQASDYLPGFHKFFKKMSEEEHEHAQKFMKYLNKRRGKIVLDRILMTCNLAERENGTMAMKIALEVEEHVYKTLLDLHTAGNDDPQFLDFLESEFLAEQVDSIKEISNHFRVLEKFNRPLGEYQFDKLTLGGDKE